MVNLDSTGTYTFTDTQTFEFDPDAAALYYTNAWDGNAPVYAEDCNGHGCPADPTDPATPSAPAPDAQVVRNEPNQGIVHTDRCVFFAGGSLSSATYTQTVQQSYTTGSGGTRASYTFTWTFTYNVAPTVDPVPQLTAWNEVGNSNGGGASIALGAFIAGESALKSRNQPLKFSYSLLESDGTLRVQNVAFSLSDGTTSTAYTPIVTYVHNAPGALTGDPGAVDFAYATNAGSNGDTSLLVNGDARTILNTDSFSGNNNGGADGSALAYAHADTDTVTLGAADYTMTVTGTVKGNSAVADLPFTITGHVIIIGKSCGQL